MEAEEPTVWVGAIPPEIDGAPTPKTPILCRMPFLPRNPPHLSWLGQAPIYAGLHTRWLGGTVHLHNPDITYGLFQRQLKGHCMNTALCDF